MPGGGGKGGGKGGGSSNVTVTSTSTSGMTVDILGLDDINMTTTLKAPDTFKTDGRTELVFPQPLRTESLSRNELAVTEPIETRMTGDMSLDIKPLVLDLCFTVNLGKPPETCITRSNSNHFGITLFGTEIFGFNFARESRTVIEDLPKRSAVAWGGEPRAHRAARAAEPARHRSHEDGGISIELGP